MPFFIFSRMNVDRLMKIWVSKSQKVSASIAKAMTGRTS